jgi:hypothetical protein
VIEIVTVGGLASWTVTVKEAEAVLPAASVAEQVTRVEPIGNVEPEPGEQLIRLSPRRGLLLVDGDPAAAADRLRSLALRAYDATGSLAGLAIEGEQLLRRLTDLDLDALPAAGGFARIGAVVVRDEGERFRVYFPQELGHYVAEVVLDTIAGLDNG